MYLSVMLDLFNNEVVSYHLNPHPSLGQVLQTVQQAVQHRPNVEGLLIHSDQWGP
ncbi:hypothetical protein SAMN05444487_1287 [Marininema mesophilum]|uniref:Transposase n=1 Tax=Marininema mesophilum TaxID=1048340 RepID=A0A1H3CUZ8_9BACL|nr:hypothetical protein SAMN05444487_1287 [Marininema mesophilum]